MSTETNDFSQVHPLTDGFSAQGLSNETSNTTYDQREPAVEDAPTSVTAKLIDEPGSAQLHALGGPIAQKDYGSQDVSAHTLVPLKENVKEVQATQVSLRLVYVLAARPLHIRSREIHSDLHSESVFHSIPSKMPVCPLPNPKRRLRARTPLSHPQLILSILPPQTKQRIQRIHPFPFLRTKTTFAQRLCR